MYKASRNTASAQRATVWIIRNHAELKTKTAAEISNLYKPFYTDHRVAVDKPDAPKKKKTKKEKIQMTTLLHGYTAKLQTCQKNFTPLRSGKNFDELLI